MRGWITLKGCFGYFEVVKSQDIFPELSEVVVSASSSVTPVCLIAEAIPLTSYDFVEEKFDFVEAMIRSSKFDSSSNSGCDNQNDRVFICVFE